MRISAAKLVVSTLAICLGAALAGSISGTVAWYQYSTRTNMAYIGSSAGVSRNMKIRLRNADDSKSYGGWKTSVTHGDVANYLSDLDIGQKVQPITPGNMSADGALPTNFYKNPVRAYEATSPYSGWLLADDSMYVTLPFQIKVEETDNKKVNDVDEELLAKDVYISKLLIQADYQNNSDSNAIRKDLSSAVRVHIHSYRDNDESADYAESTINRLISKDGGTTYTHGHLDVDGENGIDRITTGTDGDEEFDFGDESSFGSEKVLYGEGSQNAYSANTISAEDVNYYNSEGELAGKEIVYPMVVESIEKSTILKNDNLTYTKDGETEEFSKSIGQTIASVKGDENEGKYLNVDVTIWVEGWQTLPTSATERSAMWNAGDYIGSMFDVGIQFAVQPE